ncbi:hypothetical protein Tco_0795714 [Tanacetum coccineum]
MANTQSPLFQELARAADSHDIRDQLSNEVVKSIEIMRHMQVDDMETTSLRDMQTKVHEKNNFIMILRFD